MEINKNDLINNDFDGSLPAKEADVSMPVIHEDVVINKKQIDLNKIRITKQVNEENRLIEIPLIHEEIEIETVPINKYVDAFPDAVRYEGDTMIISVLKEVPVVRIFLEKEIRVTKKKIYTQHSENITLKKEEIIIEKINLTDTNQLM